MTAFLEFDERRAHFNPFAHVSQQLGDVTGLWRWHFNNCLFGFNRNQRLINDDVIAFGNVPTDDLGFLQAFTEIWEGEHAHA
jgi:hypothetical protein